MTSFPSELTDHLDEAVLVFGDERQLRAYNIRASAFFACDLQVGMT